MPEIRVETEVEGDHGWRYEITLGDESDPTPARSLDVTMAWVDYDLWSQGTVRPAHVIRAVLLYVLERRAASSPADPLPDRFDAAIVRRWYRDADSEITSRL